MPECDLAGGRYFYQRIEQIQQIFEMCVRRI